MRHRTELWFAADADYVVYEFSVDGGESWVEYSRWMVPGTQLEEDGV